MGVSGGVHDVQCEHLSCTQRERGGGGKRRDNLRDVVRRKKRQVRQNRQKRCGDRSSH